MRCLLRTPPHFGLGVGVPYSSSYPESGARALLLQPGAMHINLDRLTWTPLTNI